MEYYGNPDLKRMKLVYTHEMEGISEALAFIDRKGMMFEYAVDHWQPWVEKEPKYYNKSTIEHFCRVDHKGKVYYVGNNGTYARKYTVFEELPMVYDDDDFHWKKEDENLVSLIHDGSFDYESVYQPSGNAEVYIKYTKCEDRQIVTLAHITVHNASNREITNALREWKEKFLDSLFNDGGKYA